MKVVTAVIPIIIALAECVACAPSRHRDTAAIKLQSYSDLEKYVGQQVELEGVVSDTKCPDLNGVDVWGLDGHRGEHVRASGVLRKTIVTPAEVSAMNKDFLPNRGPGTFYSLENMKYEVLH